MADESELIKLREELNRSRRRAAFGFVILVLALVVCMLYAFVQQVAATKNTEEALRQHVIAEEQRLEARRQEAIAKEQAKAAVRSQELAVVAVGGMREAEEKLAKCKGKK